MKTSIKTIKTITIIILFTSCFALAEESSSTTSTQSIIPRPEKLEGESDDSFRNRLTQWEAEVRRLTSETNQAVPARVSTIPMQPVQHEGESDSAYKNRVRQWEVEARRVTTANSGMTASTSGIPARPEKRPGEYDAAYNARVRQWEAEVRRVSSAQAAEQKDEELKRLREQLDRLSAQVLPTPRTSSYTNTDSENMLIIPTEEMKTEDILAINEDMNVMTRIIINELNQKGITLPNYGSSSLGGYSTSYGYGATTVYGTNLGYAANPLSNMYLQGYGALFLIKAGFPLSAPSETREQPEEPDRQDVDKTWEQTRQQIYQPQVASTTSTNTIGPDAKYDAQRIENLKTTLIEALKHAANIRALQPDESVILRITGSGQSISILSVKNDGFVNYESNGIQNLVSIPGDVEDYIKSLSTPTVILIRAKKSDIDSFAKGELDLENFRQRVQIMSYPLLQNAHQSATIGSIAAPMQTTSRRSGTGTTTAGTTSSTTGRRTSRTSVVPIQPDNETDNYR